MGSRANQSRQRSFTSRKDWRECYWRLRRRADEYDRIVVAEYDLYMLDLSLSYFDQEGITVRGQLELEGYQIVELGEAEPEELPQELPVGFQELPIGFDEMPPDPEEGPSAPLDVQQGLDEWFRSTEEAFTSPPAHTRSYALHPYEEGGEEEEGDDWRATWAAWSGRSDEWDDEGDWEVWEGWDADRDHWTVEESRAFYSKHNASPCEDVGAWFQDHFPNHQQRLMEIDSNVKEVKTTPYRSPRTSRGREGCSPRRSGRGKRR